MRLNVAAKQTLPTNHNGSIAARPGSKLDQLTRAVATCMLFEGTFYEKGNEIAERIGLLALDRGITVEELSTLAIRAKLVFGLRSAPLYLLALLDVRRRELPGLVSATTKAIVTRPDQMGELLAMIQFVSGGKPIKKCLSNQIKRGLAAVFPSFNEYQLAKWNRDSEIKLRDVLFL